MAGRLFRQFPRILLSAAFAVLALVLYTLIAPDGGQFRPLLSPVGLAVMTALALAAFALPVFLAAAFAPAALTFAESLGLAFVCFAALAAEQPDRHLPFWGVALVLGLLSFAVNLMLYGPQWQRFARDFGPLRFALTVDLPPGAVWRRLFPDPATIGDYLYPGGTMTAAGPWGAARLDLPWGGGRLEQVLFPEVLEPLRHFRLRSAAPAEAIPGADEGETLDVRLVPEGGRTRVEVALTVHAVHPGTALSFRLGGMRRDIRASWRARLEGRVDRSISGRRFGRTQPLSG